MSSPPAAAPEYYSGGGGGSAPFPFTRRRQPQQHDYSFSGRVLLTAVVILAILTVLFVLVRLLLYQLVARTGRGGGGGGGGLAAGVRRSFSSRSRRGLDASALAALPVTAYRRYADGPAGSTSAPGPATDCAVCLSELADGDKVRALPSCGHVFHVECVDAWLRSRTTCPVCRADVRTKRAGDARTASAPPPALFGAGGTLVVTVQGGGASGGGGQPAGAAAG
ncbi:hypothetical protein BS78_03G019700 [Paspalum vaginatum]|nr:hypothetical protein BS78_03G019700 [Paspalum vaginatum]